MKTIERLYHETNNKLYYETKVNGVTVTLYEGLDGDYHVTRESSEWEHDHEIFEDYDKAEAFFDSLVEIEREKEIDREQEQGQEIDPRMEKMLPEDIQRLKELIWGTDTENP